MSDKNQFPVVRFQWTRIGRTKTLSLEFDRVLGKSQKRSYRITRRHLEHLLDEIRDDLLVAGFLLKDIDECLKNIRKRVDDALRAENRHELADYFKSKVAAVTTETSNSNTGLVGIHINRAFNQNTQSYYASLRLGISRDGVLHSRCRGLIRRSPDEVLDELLALRLHVGDVPKPTARQRNNALRLIREYMATQLDDPAEAKPKKTARSFKALCDLVGDE